MLSENRSERNQMEMFCIDSFVPEDHLLRKIDEALDLRKMKCMKSALNTIFQWTK